MEYGKDPKNTNHFVTGDEVPIPSLFRSFYALNVVSRQWLTDFCFLVNLNRYKKSPPKRALLRAFVDFFPLIPSRCMELRDSAKGATDCCCHGDADLPPQNRSELTKDRRNHREFPLFRRL